MFVRLSALLSAAAFTAVAVAQSSCNTGPIQCCNQVLSQTDPTITQLAGLLGVAIPSVGALAGISCTPITVIGTGTSSSCTQQPICCTDNFNGLLNLGCLPINLNA